MRNTKAHADELKTHVEGLWNAGHSAAVIARMIDGLTRNAVIGIVHRLRNRGGDMRARPPRDPKPVAVAVPEPPPAVVDCTPLLVPMERRTEAQCPYPMWPDDAASGGPDFLVCGAAKERDDWFCAGHTKLCLTGKRPPPRAEIAGGKPYFRKPGRFMSARRTSPEEWAS